jgi:hypothetical protein
MTKEGTKTNICNRKRSDGRNFSMSSEKFKVLLLNLFVGRSLGASHVHFPRGSCAHGESFLIGRMEEPGAEDGI